MNELGPTDNSGLRRDAFTAWHVYWKWPLTADRPDFQKAQSFCDITVTLPHWTDPAGADSKLSRKWRDFSVSLSAHEARHVEFVSQVFPGILDAIKDTAVKNPALDAQKANDLGQEYLSRLRQMDREYDQRTKNGRAEGLRFP